MGLPRAPLSEGETMLLVLRPHVRRLAWPALVLLGVAPATGLVAGFVPGDARTPVRVLVLLVGAAVLLRWVVRPFLTWWNTVYAVSTMRIMAYRGILRRSGHEVPLSAVVDVAVEQRVLDRMTGSGTLVVSSAGGVELALPDVPQVVAVQRALHRLTDDPDRDPWQGPDDPDYQDVDQDGDPEDDVDPDDDLPLPQPPRGRGPRAWFGGPR